MPIPYSQRAAAVYSVVVTPKLNGIEPEAYPHRVLERIAHYPINRIEDPLAGTSRCNPLCKRLREMTTRKATSRSSGQLLQLKIELSRIKPSIWRRVVVPETITLAKLHRVIQAVMGWTGSHLHEFEIVGERYGVADPELGFGEPVISEARARLGKCLGGAAALRYLYDFGDDWEHRIKVEKVLPTATSLHPLMY